MPLYRVRCTSCGEVREEQLSYVEFDRARETGKMGFSPCVCKEAKMEVVPSGFTFKLVTGGTIGKM